MNAAAAIGIETGTTANVGTQGTPSLPGMDGAGTVRPASSSTGLDAGAEAGGSWKTLWQALGLTMPTQSAAKPAGAPRSLISAKVESASPEDGEPAGEPHLERRRSSAFELPSAKLKIPIVSAGRVPGKEIARGGSDHAGRLSKTKLTGDADPPAINTAYAGTELVGLPPVAIPTSFAGISALSAGSVLPSLAHPNLPIPDSAPHEPGGKGQLSVSETVACDPKHGLQPIERRVAPGSVAAPPGDTDSGMLSTPVVHADMSPPKDSIAAQNVAVAAELHVPGPLATPTHIVEQPTEPRRGPAPATVADPPSQNENHAPLPIPADSTDAFERTTIRGTSSIGGWDEKSVKEQGTKPGSLKIAVDGNHEGRPFVGNESISSSPTLTHDPAAMVDVAEKHANAPAQGATVISDPFHALDAARIPPHAWIHAGAHHAEAGYLDPALGWIGIRADATASGIHAALVPGSTEAAQVLGSTLAGLNAHLADHQRESAMVTVAAPHDGQNGSGMGPGTHTGDGNSPHRHPPHGGEAFDEGESLSIPQISGNMLRAGAETTGVPTGAGGGKTICLVA